MRVVVIGGTGHIGTFLIPRLVRAGYEVVCLHRGGKPYVPSKAWNQWSISSRIARRRCRRNIRRQGEQPRA